MKQPTLQQGFTLIELLLSVVLGMIFTSGAATFLISSRSMQNLQDSSSRIQEHALYVMDEMVSSIKMAGYYNLLSPGADVPTGRFYTGACGSFDPCTADGTDASTHYSDRIAIMLNPPEDDGTDGDCVGNVIDSDPIVAARSVVANLYRVENIEGINTLVCESFLINSLGVATSITADPYELVGGIDSLQVLYGITDMSNVSDINTTVSRYISATSVDGATAPVGASSAWADIATVRLAVLSASGFDDGSAMTSDQHFNLMDADAMYFADKNLRKMYTSTVLINNARM